MIQSVMNYNLLARKMCVPKRRRNIQGGVNVGSGRNFVQSYNFLKHRKAHGKKTGIGWGDGHSNGTVLHQTDFKEKNGQVLRSKPLNGFLPKSIKGNAHSVNKQLLVGGFIIGNEHGVGVATAHIGFRIIG